MSLATAFMDCFRRLSTQLFQEHRFLAILWSFRPPFTKTGRSIPKSFPTMRVITKRARPFPKTYWKRALPPINLTRVTKRSNTYPQLYWIWDGIPFLRRKGQTMLRHSSERCSKSTVSTSRPFRLVIALPFLLTSGQAGTHRATTLIYGARCWPQMPLPTCEHLAD